jgi:hypothetical protein
VTTHGLALNRDPDLTWFSRMSACGAPDVRATSIVAEGGNPDCGRVEAALCDALAKRLQTEFEKAPLEDLYGVWPPPPHRSLSAIDGAGGRTPGRLASACPERTRSRSPRQSHQDLGVRCPYADSALDAFEMQAQPA